MRASSKDSAKRGDVKFFFAIQNSKRYYPAMIFTVDQTAPTIQGACVDARSLRPTIDPTMTSSFELQPGASAVPGKPQEQVEMNDSGKTNSHPPRC